MKKHSIWALAALALACSAQAVHASPVVSVAAGWDLLQTASGTSVNGVDFTGVPLGSYNFGGAIGTQNTGNTDTIIQRSTAATLGGPPPGTAPSIGIVMTALQLETIAPVNLGAGTGFYFLTLQSARGGPASTGAMTIDFASSLGGTFSSSLDVFFDIRFGSLTGAIVQSSDRVITASGLPWGRTPPADALTITGANLNLNGFDSSSDFWVSPFNESGPNFTDNANATLTPEPASLALVALGGMLLLRRRP